MAGTAAVPDMRLELVPLPVSDVDRARAFYEQVGFGNVHDTQVTETMRVVQLTPPGSSCAIVFGTGMGPITDMAPGSIKGLHLVVEDMAATRAALTVRAWPAAASPGLPARLARVLGRQVAAGEPVTAQRRNPAQRTGRGERRRPAGEQDAFPHAHLLVVGHRDRADNRPDNQP